MIALGATPDDLGLGGGDCRAGGYWLGICWGCHVQRRPHVPSGLFQCRLLWHKLLLMLLLLKLWLKLLLSWLEILLYCLELSLLERGDRFGRALIDLPDKALQTSREGVGDSLDLWSAGCAAELQIWNRFVRFIIITVCQQWQTKVLPSCELDSYLRDDA